MNDVEGARVVNPSPASEDDTRTARDALRVLAVVLVLGFVLYTVRPILLPFVAAGATAFALSPAIDVLAPRVFGSRTLAAVVVFVIIVAIVGGLGALAAPMAVHEVMDFVSHLQSQLGKLISGMTGGRPLNLAGTRITPEKASAEVIAMVRNWATAGGHAFVLMGWAFGSMFGVFLTLVLLFYFLVSGPVLRERMFGLIPPKQRNGSHRIWALSAPLLRRYFIGVALVVLYTTVAAYLGLGLFLHVPNAVILAVLTGILEMIPVIGPFAAALIAGLAAVDNASGMWGILAFIIYAICLRLSIDQLVGPLVLGKAASVHPTVVIFSFLAGGILFGITGLVLAVPAALVVRVTLAVVYDDETVLQRLAGDDG